MASGHTINWTKAIDSRIPLISCNFIVNERRIRTPVPQRNDQVALFPCGARRPLRSFTGRNTVRPISEHIKCALSTEATQRRTHRRSALASLHAMVPRRCSRIKFVDMLHFTRCSIPKLVTQLTTLFHDVQPCCLAFQTRGNTISTRPSPREFTGCGRFDQRVPVIARIVLRSRLFIRCNHTRQVNVFCRRR